jgi:hypothetical protein
MRVEQLELDPSQEHEELEELRVRTRLCFDKAWEAFTPLLERQVSIPASAGLTPETAKAVTEHLNQMWKVRTFQSLDRTANLLMKYELELDELRKK